MIRHIDPQELIPYRVTYNIKSESYLTSYAKARLYEIKAWEHSYYISLMPETAVTTGGFHLVHQQIDAPLDASVRDDIKPLLSSLWTFLFDEEDDDEDGFLIKGIEAEYYEHDKEQAQKIRHEMDRG